MGPFELVAIDVDGVLRDSSRLFYECHKRALGIAGMEEEFSRCFGVKDVWHFKGLSGFSDKRNSISAMYSIEKSGRLGLIRDMIYEPDAEARISRLLDSCSERPTKDELDLMVGEYVRAVTESDARSLVRLYPGASDSVNRLRSAGIKTAIVSSSDILTIERDLEELLKQFDYVVSSRDVRVMKPSGEGLKLVSRRSGIGPDRIAYIGDTVVDVRAARDAGCVSIVVSSGMGLESHIRKEKPDFIFGDLKEAVEGITGQRP
jgi:HAD superfamily hydrolase (TIGR01509 family)